MIVYIIHATAMQQTAARAKKGASRRMHLKAVPKHQHCIKQAVKQGDIDKALKLMNEAERLGSKSARSTFISSVKGKRRMHLKAVPKHQHCGETITPCLLHC
jgi:maltose operon protein